MVKKIGISVLVLALIGAAIGYYLFQKPVASFSSDAPAFSLSSEVLFDEFANDEVAALALYEGKLIEVRGPVVELMENSDGSTTLILAANDPIFGVKCRLDPGEAEVPTVSQGDVVQLKGLCIGMNSDVELDRCILISTN